MSAREKIGWLYGLSRSTLWVFFKLFFHLKVRGVENVPDEGPCIVACNHASYLDPPIVGAGIKRRMVRFMARDTLYRTPFAQSFLTKVHTVPIDRTRGDVGALRRALKALAAGGVLGLFPEGTRTPDGNLQKAKGGIGFLIAKARVPVVPAYVEGSFQALPKDAKRLRFSRLTLTIGPPILPEEWQAMGADRSSYDRIGELVMARIAALKESSGS
ncbi:MAG: 1-acyl-sn-glycerol-3-phosphate acyltransferase [Kiritimatiellae bacterium]|nr:1-acyl-sn-glycerol-3-phosphate acyltransferase [Kiritimatiellia bacterium]